VRGQVAVVPSHGGGRHLLRVWVNRPTNWRALGYQEVKLLDAPQTVTPGEGQKRAILAGPWDTR